MTKFNYYKLSKAKKIRYLKLYQKNCDYIVFLHGFMSDLDGKKPRSFLKFAQKNKLGFLALEYSGHGKSYGKFEDGTITSWTKDAKNIIRKKIKQKKLILVGSSMGGWIGLNLFKSFKKNIHAFIGIAPAPEFLDRLMWKNFTKKVKRQLINEKFYRPTEVDILLGDCSKAKENLDWKPKCSFDSLIEMMVDADLKFLS